MIESSDNCKYVTQQQQFLSLPLSGKSFPFFPPHLTANLKFLDRYFTKTKITAKQYYLLFLHHHPLFRSNLQTLFMFMLRWISADLQSHLFYWNLFQCNIFAYTVAIVLPSSCPEKYCKSLLFHIHIHICRYKAQAKVQNRLFPFVSRISLSHESR